MMPPNCARMASTPPQFRILGVGQCSGDHVGVAVQYWWPKPMHDVGAELSGCASTGVAVVESTATVTCRVRECTRGGDVRRRPEWIRWCFDRDELRPAGESVTASWVAHVDEFVVHRVVAKFASQLRSDEHDLRRQHVIARRQRLADCRGCGHAGAKSRPGTPALEQRTHALLLIERRIVVARVDVRIGCLCPGCMWLIGGVIARVVVPSSQCLGCMVRVSFQTILSSVSCEAATTRAAR